MFREGNLKELDETLHEHQHFFIKCGIFLMLEKLKIVTYRNLFKKMYVAHMSDYIESSPINFAPRSWVLIR